MANLHKEYVGSNSYNSKIKLTQNRKDKLKKSRKALRKKIKKWFRENQPNELQPEFRGQGSIEHNSILNPIVEYNEDGDALRKYDLDDGIYFIEKEGEDNRKPIQTWHNWVYQAVEDHTDTPPIRKTTCVRVVFSDGHHIDLPIYYSKEENTTPELTHKSKGWIDSDPKEFTDWFLGKKTPQLVRIVRYFKGWKNHRQIQNSHLKLPSGFELTILATNNYSENDNDDVAFRETTRNIQKALNAKFECYRPTTPSNEDLFKNYSKTRKNDFLTNLGNLLIACDDADQEKNFKKASEYLRNQFGERLPFGKDEDEKKKSNRLKTGIASTRIKTKPYGRIKRN